MQTIQWHNGKVRFIDQTKLPQRLVYIETRDVKALWRAIRTLQVRGAPVIGVAVAFGVVLGVRGVAPRASYRDFKRKLDKVIAYLASARPTAINLFWALDRMNKVVGRNKREAVSAIKEALLNEALLMIEEDKRVCRQMAKNGAKFIKDGDTILTHCNAGALATVDYGTALGVLYYAKAQDKRFKVYADETRPLLQGARLTAWELMRHNIDVTVICDNMAASLMQKGKIDKVFVGADRIARNGDAANKIGTYNLAVLAHYHKIPFYVVAPLSSFDFNIKSGREIPIEERPQEEVVRPFGRQIAPRKAKAYNPAFDVTPASLITAIITEDRIFLKRDIQLQQAL